MKTYRNILSAVSLLLCLFTFGCAQQPPSVTEPPEPPTLKMVHYLNPDGKSPYEVEYFKLVHQYAEEANVHIEVNVLPWDQLDDILVVSAQTNEPLGDLCVMSAQKVEYLVNHNALMPLDDYFRESFREDEFLPFALDCGASALDGHMYGMLQSIHTRGLWYHKSMVPEPPRTLKELISISHQIMADHDGVWGLGFWGGKHYGAVECTLASQMWGLGGRFTDSKGRAEWDGPALERSIRMMYDWVYRNRISPLMCLTTPDMNDVRTMFFKGHLAMILDTCVAFDPCDWDEDIAFAPMPGVEGLCPSFSNGWCLGIPSNAEHPDLAWNFIRWASSKEFQIAHAGIEGSLPTRPDALHSPEIANEPMFAQFADVLFRYGRKMDPVYYYSEAMEELASVANRYCLDPSVDLERLLSDSANRFNRKFCE